VALVRVVRLADPSLELHPAPLLHDVRGLVRGRVQIRRPGERHARARGIGLGAHRLTRLLGGSAHVGADPCHVMAPERALDRIEVGQRATTALEPALRRREDTSRRALAPPWLSSPEAARR
jgi:hypothetical protein